MTSTFVNLDQVRQQLTTEQAEGLFEQIIAGELTQDQLEQVLLNFNTRPIAAAELAGAATALRAAAKPFGSVDKDFVDIVGTGGDKSNTINISTAAAIVSAAMNYPVIKHGNRAVSSASGTSDVQAALGMPLLAEPEQARALFAQTNYCFIPAPFYHSGFKHVAPVRAKLKVPTIFNLLGPLVSPACPKRQLLGVYKKELVELFAQACAQLGHVHTYVVHAESLDEIGLHTETYVAQVRNGQVEYFTLTPEDFGFERQELSVLKGGNPEQNAQALKALFAGQGNKFHAQAVALQVALASCTFSDLTVAQVKEQLPQRTQQVLDFINSGKVLPTYQAIVAVGKELSNA